MKRSFLLLASILLTGCGSGGPSTGSFEGKVTLKGQPVSGSKVSLISSGSGAGAILNIGADGSFKSTDPLPVGTYKVALVPAPPEPMAPGTKAAKAAPSLIPDKYQKVETSGFSAEIKAGKNSTSFDIP